MSGLFNNAHKTLAGGMMGDNKVIYGSLLAGAGTGAAAAELTGNDAFEGANIGAQASGAVLAGATLSHKETRNKMLDLVEGQTGNRAHGRAMMGGAAGAMFGQLGGSLLGGDTVGGQMAGYLGGTLGGMAAGAGAGYFAPKFSKPLGKIMSTFNKSKG